MKRRPILSPLFVVLMCTSVYAQKSHETFQITPYFSLHGYTWKEFDDNGGENLKESGPRFAFGVIPRYSFLQKKNLYVEMDLQYAVGTVDYAGYKFDLQTNAKTPFTTQTSYADFEVGAYAGYIFDISRMYQITPVAGFGFEQWKRGISPDDPSGYDEKYSVFLADIGVTGTIVLTRNVELFSGVMLKIPLSISESIDQFPRGQAQFTNISLSPGSNPRFVVEAGGSAYRVFATLYFETWTLSKSAEDRGLLQPESTRTNFGVRLGYTFGVM